MKQLLFVALSLISLAQSFAQLSASASPLWLRSPAISPDGTAIVFTAIGGRALLLTTHEAMDSDPVWSHDGKWIAFSSNRYGNKDVFIMPSDGGLATRLTFHSSDDTPTDLTPDDSGVIF